MIVKKSYGIILCRNIGRENEIKFEVLLVQKRHTYAYMEFLNGHYDPKDNRRLINILSHMTIEELIDIWSLEFKYMWYRFIMETNETPFYCKKERKFYNSFIKRDGGRTLRKMIERIAPSGSLIYEFPKGRKDSPKETDLACAIRELQEEANVPRKQYKIIPGFVRKHSFVHMNVQYDNIYFLAVMKRPLVFQPIQSITIKNGEVSGAYWMSIENVKIVDNSRFTLARLTRSAFNFLRNHFKGKYVLNITKIMNVTQTQQEKQISEIIAEGNKIFSKILDTKYDIANEAESDALLDKLRDEHKDFATTLPLVLRVMVQMKKYSQKALTRYLKKMKADMPKWKSRQDFIESQADYMVILYKTLTPHYDMRKIKEMKEEIRKQLLDEDDEFQKMVKEAEKEAEQKEKEIEDQRRRDLYNAILSLKSLQVEEQEPAMQEHSQETEDQRKKELIAKILQKKVSAE